MANSYVVKLEQELQTISKSVQGKVKVDAMVSLNGELSPANKKEDLIKVIKELYSFSKKTLELLKKSPGETKESAVDVSAIVRETMTSFMPGLLEKALNDMQLRNEPVDKTRDDDDVPRETHILTLEKRAGPGSEEPQKITENEWTDVVKKNVRNKLQHVPLKQAPTLTKEGAGRLRFNTKEHMDSAKVALAEEYNMTSDSREVKMLEPKLTMHDLKGDFDTPENLRLKILEKNSSIKRLVDDGDMFRVVFLDKTEKDWACLQVSPRIRQCIRQSRNFIHADLREYRVSDRYHVVQCFDCQRFGHMSGSEHCKCKKHNASPTCFYCAGSHKSKECNKKQNKDTSSMKCVNCSQSRFRSQQDKCRTHTAADRLCPSYVYEQSQIMGRTSGCKESKNYYLQRTKALQKERGIVL